MNIYVLIYTPWRCAYKCTRFQTLCVPRKYFFLFSINSRMSSYSSKYSGNRPSSPRSKSRGDVERVKAIVNKESLSDVRRVADELDVYVPSLERDKGKNAYTMKFLQYIHNGKLTVEDLEGAFYK